MSHQNNPQAAARNASADAQRLAAQLSQDGGNNGRSPSRWDQRPEPTTVAGISNLPPGGAATAQPVNVIPGQPMFIPRPPPGAPPPPPGLNPMAAPWAPVANMLQQVSRTLDAVTKRNSSRGFDGEVVTVKDISNIFDEVPVPLLARGEYIKSLAMKLEANTSGIRFKSDPFEAVGVGHLILMRPT